MRRGCLQNATRVEGLKLVTRKPVHGGWLDTRLTKEIGKVLTSLDFSLPWAARLISVLRSLTLGGIVAFPPEWVFAVPIPRPILPFRVGPMWTD